MLTTTIGMVHHVVIRNKKINFILIEILINYFKVQKKDFGVACTIPTECNDLIGLTCPSTSNTSSCASLAANLCDCPSGYYYNTTLKNCGIYLKTLKKGIIIIHIIFKLL